MRLHFATVTTTRLDFAGTESFSYRTKNWTNMYSALIKWPYRSAAACRDPRSQPDMCAPASIIVHQAASERKHAPIAPYWYLTCGTCC